jgi:hypothetical protein
MDAEVFGRGPALQNGGEGFGVADATGAAAAAIVDDDDDDDDDDVNDEEANRACIGSTNGTKPLGAVAVLLLVLVDEQALSGELDGMTDEEEEDTEEVVDSTENGEASTSARGADAISGDIKGETRLWLSAEEPAALVRDARALVDWCSARRCAGGELTPCKAVLPVPPFVLAKAAASASCVSSPLLAPVPAPAKFVGVDEADIDAAAWDMRRERLAWAGVEGWEASRCVGRGLKIGSGSWDEITLGNEEGKAQVLKAWL